MAEAPHPLRVFLCHSSDDKQVVRELYQRLRADGFDPWLDEKNILAGQDWEREIAKAVRACHIVLICLSCGSISKKGFVQKEIKYALDVADEQPDDTIYLIPIMLEECAIPERLRRLHWVRLFEAGGYERLLDALRYRAKFASAAIPSPKVESGGRTNPLIDSKQAVWDRLARKIQQRPAQSVGEISGLRKWIIGAAILLLIISFYIILRSPQQTSIPPLSIDLVDISKSLLPDNAQVKVSGVAGHITNSQGIGVANVFVYLSGEDGKGFKAVTDGNGIFKVGGVVPGKHSIEIYHPNFEHIIPLTITTLSNTVTCIVIRDNQTNLMYYEKLPGRSGQFLPNLPQ